MLRNFGQIILIIVIVVTGDTLQDCVHFEKESGFVKLAERSVIKEDSLISLEFKAYNCDKVSLGFHNGENYKFSIYGNDLNFLLVQYSCNGLWNEGISYYYVFAVSKFLILLNSLYSSI